MDAREHKKQEETRKFMEYRCSLKGDVESQFCRGSYLTLPPPLQPIAATLPQTTVPLWHSSASKQVDRPRVRSAAQLHRFTKVVSVQSFAGCQHS